MEQGNSNAALYFVDRHLKDGLTNKAAFIEAIDGGRQLNYGELAEASDRLAALYARNDLRPEDRAAMIVLDRIEFPIIFWGSLKAGIIPVPLNTLLTAEMYTAILKDSRAKALFVSHELLETVMPAIENSPHLKAIFVVGGEAGEHKSFAAELVASKPRPAIEAMPDECAFWLYSSGSTGRPKGVRHVHSSLKATSDSYAAQVLGIESGDVVYSAAKLFFAYGLGNAMTFPMSVGATSLLFPGRPTPDAVFSIMARGNPTIFCGVPTLYAAMLAAMNGARPAGCEYLRFCISAGEALPQEIGVQWRDLIDVDILDGVGSTEMLHIFLSNAPGNVVYGTSGIPVPGYKMRLVNENGLEAGVGEIGELLVNGPSAADGYWNQREKSRSTFEGHWTRTGDKYERREDGRLTYCGRTDDMFKVSGIWLAPFEVEQALVSHRDVLEAAVVAAADEYGLEKPKAFVVLKTGVVSDGLAEDLKEHVKARIGPWKYPRWIEFVSTLPKTATGKVQRFKLREAGAGR